MWHPMAPQTQMVNDSSVKEVSERDPQTQFMITNTSNRVQNQSSRQALMASISSDMNPYSAVVIENTLVKTAQALNRDTNEEPSVTCSNNKDNFDVISVYEDSYTLEH